LVQNTNVARYLEVRHPDIAAEFRSIVGAASLDAP
ncbi:chromosome partitioning protein ParB, partial [Stenotrophomonas sp. HMWF022]